MAKGEKEALPHKDKQGKPMIRRKNYFIKKRFQISFLYRFILLLLLELVLIAGLFMHISSDTLTTGYLDSILRIERTPSFFFVPTLLIMLIVGVGIGISGMIIFILLSHRIAGPLYRFEEDLKEIGSGNLTKRVNLRKTDQLIELKEALNTLVESLDQRLRHIKNRLEMAKKILAEKDSPENAAKMRKALELLEDEIDQFKVTSGPGE